MVRYEVADAQGQLPPVLQGGVDEGAGGGVESFFFSPLVEA